MQHASAARHTGGPRLRVGEAQRLDGLGPWEGLLEGGRRGLGSLRVVPVCGGEPPGPRQRAYRARQAAPHRRRQRRQKQHRLQAHRPAKMAEKALTPCSIAAMHGCILSVPPKSFIL